MNSPAVQFPATSIFSPLQLGDLTLPNRMVMAPLTRNRAGAGNVPGPMNVEYYVQRASAGLIISEATQISPQGVGYPATPGIHSAEQVAGWREVTDAVHAAGGRMFLQLWHVGRISHPSLQPDGALPVAPSAIQPAGEAVTYQGMQRFVTPRALETGEIPGIVADYRHAAENARAAGFDGIEIHGANGYLIDQFLRDSTNLRTDEYGGSLANRTRLLFDVLTAVCEVWPSSRVGLRLSPSTTFNDMHDSDPRAHFGEIIRQLNAYKLAYLHLIEPNEADARHGAICIPSHEFRPLYQGTLIVCDGYDGAKAQRAISNGDTDLVAFGRLFLANPDLPARLKTGAALNTPDPDTFYGGDSHGYTDYPAMA